MPAPPITTVVVDQYGDVVTVPAAVTTGVVISGAGPQGPAGVDGSLAPAKIPDWVANTTVQANEVRRLPDGTIGRWIGPVGTTGATFNAANWTVMSAASTTILVDSFVNQAIYATTYDAVQAAIDAAVTATTTSPVTLEFGNRTYDVNKGATYLTGGQFLKVPPGLTNWLRITGRGKARIQFGVGTPGFLGPKNVAAGVTYGKVEIDGFTFDANNVTAAAVGIITHFNNDDVNYDGFYIHDSYGINAGPPNGTGGRRWININVNASVAFDVANPRVMNDIRVERLNCVGGNTGALISAYAKTNPVDNTFVGQTVPAANVTLDRIVIKDFRWDSGGQFYGSAGSAGIQTGGDGITKSVYIEGCWLKGGCDVGIEIGGVVDGVVKNCVCENFVNDAFFLANNHGGLPKPERQHVRFENCTAIRSDSRLTPMAGFATQANHNSKFGFVEFVNCTFRHSAPDFQQLNGTGPTGSPTAPFLLLGSWLQMSVRNASIIYDSFYFTFTSTVKSFSPATFDINQSYDNGILEIKDCVTVYQGTFDSGGNTATAFQVDGIKLRGSRLHLDVDGHRIWTNLSIAGTPSPALRVRDVNFSSSGAYTDSFSNSSLSKDYLVDAGALSDLTYATGPLTSIANHTTRKSFRAPAMNTAAVGGLMNLVGRVVDGSAHVMAVVPTTLQGFELFTRLRVSDDGQSGLRGKIDDDGTNSWLRIERVVSGVATTLASAQLPARLVAGNTVAVRFMQRGDVLTADYYIGTATPAFTAVGSTRVTYTLTGTDPQQFRAAGAPGYVGFGWTPNDATSTLSQFRYTPMAVYVGKIRGLSPLGNVQHVNTMNAVVGGDSTLVRIESPPLILGWDRAAISLDGGSEFNGPDSTFKQNILVEQGSNWSAQPAAAAITVTASPFVYTNQDGYIEDVAIYGGTLTTPFIEISKDNGATFNQIAGSSVEKIVRLSPGDQIRVTYSVAPTMRKIPVL